ncbi:MAG: hypothetical protein ACR2JX_07875 [Mycobacteriales bacterium]
MPELDTEILKAWALQGISAAQDEARRGLRWLPRPTQYEHPHSYDAACSLIAQEAKRSPNALLLTIRALLTRPPRVPGDGKELSPAAAAAAVLISVESGLIRAVMDPSFYKKGEQKDNQAIGVALDPLGTARILARSTDVPAHLNAAASRILATTSNRLDRPELWPIRELAMATKPDNPQTPRHLLYGVVEKNTDSSPTFLVCDNIEPTSNLAIGIGQEGIGDTLRQIAAHDPALQTGEFRLGASNAYRWEDHFTDLLRHINPSAGVVLVAPRGWIPQLRATLKQRNTNVREVLASEELPRDPAVAAAMLIAASKPSITWNARVAVAKLTRYPIPGTRRRYRQ